MGAFSGLGNLAGAFLGSLPGGAAPRLIYVGVGAGRYPSAGDFARWFRATAGQYARTSGPTVQGVIIEAGPDGWRVNPPIQFNGTLRELVSMIGGAIVESRGPLLAGLGDTGCVGCGVSGAPRSDFTWTEVGPKSPYQREFWHYGQGKFDDYDWGKVILFADGRVLWTVQGDPAVHTAASVAAGKRAVEAAAASWSWMR